jgi:hypothetical protein
MGRGEKEALTASQILYPLMQCADIFFLKVCMPALVILIIYIFNGKKGSLFSFVFKIKDTELLIKNLKCYTRTHTRFLVHT